MKCRLLARTPALVFILFSSCQSPEPADKGGETTSTEVKLEKDPKVVEAITSVVQQHDKALNEQDLDALMETFVPGPDTVLLGTSNAERFIGSENIRNAYIEIFKDFDSGTLEVECDWKTGQHLGDMAWLAGTCQAQDSLEGNPRVYGLNVTGALVRQDNQWRFAMLHMSNPTVPQ
jgi:ketosteroid isomerase-like protein